jgi:hypothetical protein
MLLMYCGPFLLKVIKQCIYTSSSWYASDYCRTGRHSCLLLVDSNKHADIQIMRINFYATFRAALRLLFASGHGAQIVAR